MARIVVIGKGKMAKYKVVKYNIGFGEVEYSVARKDGIDLVPVLPIRYYKTKKGAEKKILKLMMRK